VFWSDNVTYHDAQHLIPHMPDEYAPGSDAPVYCSDCGEPIAHVGAACANCLDNLTPYDALALMVTECEPLYKSGRLAASVWFAAKAALARHK